VAYLLQSRLLNSSAARIINLTAPATHELDFDDLQGEQQFNSFKAFDATNMARLLFTYELARRLENTGVTVHAVHPGLVRSEIRREANPLIRFFAWLFAFPPNQAAEAVVKLATAPEFAQTSGKFWHKGKEIQAPAYALDTVNQQRLWEISEKLTNASESGPNYDPTGSVALTDKRDIPP
jgi:NAD(P)-dependent dehydrogenase (short-subunit alcohol dehydrogenase family)